MTTLICMGVVTSLISCCLLLFNMILYPKLLVDREKSTSFECGFDSFYSSRIPFSIQFFLLSIMFLTFDIEIALMVPIIPSMFSLSIYWLMSSVFFVLILMVGLIFEWMENSITWSI